MSACFKIATEQKIEKGRRGEGEKGRKGEREKGRNITLSILKLIVAII
jgi:hypothetical protein